MNYVSFFLFCLIFPFCYALLSNEEYKALASQASAFVERKELDPAIKLYEQILEAQDVDLVHGALVELANIYMTKKYV